jgi:hypothetical protein
MVVREKDIRSKDSNGSLFREQVKGKGISPTGRTGEQPRSIHVFTETAKV